MPTKSELIHRVNRLSTLSHDETVALEKSPKAAIECLIRLVEDFRDRTFGDAATVLLHEGRYYNVRKDGSTTHPAIPQIVSAHQIDERGNAVESYLLTTILDTPHAIPWIVNGKQNVVLIGDDGERLAGWHEMFVIRIRRDEDWPVLDAVVDRDVEPAPVTPPNQQPEQVEMFALDDSAEDIALGVELWSEIEPFIERYIDEYGQKHWHYLPGQQINGDGQHAIYTGWYNDENPVGQPHNSFVRVYEMEDYELWERDVDRVLEEEQRGTEIS